MAQKHKKPRRVRTLDDSEGHIDFELRVLLFADPEIENDQDGWLDFGAFCTLKKARARAQELHGSEYGPAEITFAGEVVERWL